MPVTVKHVKSSPVADFTGTVTVFNSTGGTQTTLATALILPSDWNSAHNITYNISASELTGVFSFNRGLTSSTASSGITVGINPPDYFEPFVLPNTNSTLVSTTPGLWYFDPVVFPSGISNGLLNFFNSNAAGFVNGAVYSAASSGSISRYQTMNQQVAFYSQLGGTSVNSLTSFYSYDASTLFTWVRAIGTTVSSQLTVSNYLTASFPSQFNSTGGVTYGSTAQSGTVSVAASTGASTMADSLITGVVAYVSGARMDRIPLTTAINPGNYWIGLMFSSTSSSTGTNYSTGTMMSTQSRIGLLENNLGAYKANGASVSNSTTTPVLLHGFIPSASSIQATIASNLLRGASTRAYWNYVVTGF